MTKSKHYYIRKTHRNDFHLPFTINTEKEYMAELYS